MMSADDPPTTRLCVAVLLLIALASCGDRPAKSYPENSARPEAKSTAEPGPGWVIAPGQVGPLKVGIDGGNAKLMGFAKGSPGESCGHVWVESDELAAGGIHLDFRDGRDTDDLDQILVADSDPEDGDRPASLNMRTAEGAGIGTRFAKLQEIYGDRLMRGEYVMEGGGWIGYTVFGPGGAMTFDAGSTEQEEGPTVLRIFATGGKPGKFDPPFLGC